MVCASSPAAIIRGEVAVSASAKKSPLMLFISITSCLFGLRLALMSLLEPFLKITFWLFFTACCSWDRLQHELYC
jgi:hypothetical protein